MSISVTSDKWQVARAAVPASVGRDSVEPRSERSEASVASILVGRLCPYARSARADCVGKQGSTESHPTGLACARRTCPLSPASAFTLLEVMIAVAIFFMCVFAVLELVSQNLKNVQRLQKPAVDIGSLACELSLTNRLEEGGDSGDFGRLYPGVSWSRNVTMVGTNGLFQVDFTVQDGSAGGRFPVESRLSIFLYRPESKMGVGSGLLQ